MEEIDSKLPKGYIEGFNNGYVFSKKFPEVAQSITEQNKSSEELIPINGLLGGLVQGLREGRELYNERLNELKDIESLKNGDIEHDIEQY